MCACEDGSAVLESKAHECSDVCPWIENMPSFDVHIYSSCSMHQKSPKKSRDVHLTSRTTNTTVLERLVHEESFGPRTQSGRGILS